jgi:glycine hydroxymethyltransferase
MFFEALRKTDPEIFEAIYLEVKRQNETLELIASENFTSLAVLTALGSPLTNKYAEGYPSKRYYGGCEFVDIAEQLAIERAKKLFNAERATTFRNTGEHGGIFFSFTARRYYTCDEVRSRRAPIPRFSS